MFRTWAAPGQARLAPRTGGRKGASTPAHAAQSTLAPTRRRELRPTRVSLTPPPLLSRSHVRSSLGGRCSRHVLVSSSAAPSAVFVARGSARLLLPPRSRRSRHRPEMGVRHHALGVPSPHPRPVPLPLQVTDSGRWPGPANAVPLQPAARPARRAHESHAHRPPPPLTTTPTASRSAPLDLPHHRRRRRLGLLSGRRVWSGACVSRLAAGRPAAAAAAPPRP